MAREDEVLEGVLFSDEIYPHRGGQIQVDYEGSDHVSLHDSDTFEVLAVEEAATGSILITICVNYDNDKVFTLELQ